MIKLENLTCGYGPISTLENINWHIRPKEHWVITGAMGAGKTSLAKTILGKTRRLHGKILYFFLQNSESYEERKTKIHMVSFTDTGKLFNSVNAIHYYQQRYQAFDSDGHLTVQAYLEDGGLNLSDPLHLEFIDLMNLGPLLDLERIKLSSGQTRKLLLCKAFLGRPKFLVLDNPHIGLDDSSRISFNRYLDQLVQHFDQQVILSGHFRSLPEIINRQIHLSKGRINYCGPLTNEITDTEPDINDLKTTRVVQYFLPVVQKFKHEQILRLQEVTIKYEDKVVINGLNWEVNKGEKWLVQGANGSGKSTIISLIYGDHPQAYSNNITLFGRKRGSGESIWDIKKRIGFTSPELHSFFNYNHPAHHVVLTGLTDTFFVQKKPPEKVKLCRALFDYFNLLTFWDTPFRNLSTGTQRLLFFMRALIKSPPVLLMDEPYQGFDKPTIEKCNLLLERILTPEHTLIFISHFQDEVPKLIEKTLTLDQATII